MPLGQARSVLNFTVYNKHGSIKWPGTVDITNTKLDQVVIIKKLSIEVYPNGVTKPPMGTKLRKPHQIIKYQVNIELTPDQISKEMTKQDVFKQNLDVISYDEDTQTLVFNGKVE